MRPSALSLQRKPTITQSAVLCCFTFSTASREPGRYGESRRFAMTPSSPAASSEPSHFSATAGARGNGDRRNFFARPERSLAAVVLEHAAKAVPLRLVLPVAVSRQRVDELCLHRRERHLGSWVAHARSFSRSCVTVRGDLGGRSLV